MEHCVSLFTLSGETRFPVLKHVLPFSQFRKYADPKMSNRHEQNVTFIGLCVFHWIPEPICGKWGRVTMIALDQVSQPSNY